LFISEPQSLSNIGGISIAEILRNIWAQLNVTVTNNDQNFYEHGGSSLLAMQFLYPFVY
jgi:hypothetical protein